MLDFEEPALSEAEEEEEAENLRSAARRKPTLRALLLQNGANFDDDESVIEAWRLARLDTLVQARKTRDEMRTLMAARRYPAGEHPLMQELSDFIERTTREFLDRLAEQCAQIHAARALPSPHHRRLTDA